MNVSFNAENAILKVCVIVPAHNEAQYIAGVVAAVRVQNLDIVVIDDGSFDATSDLAKGQGATVLRNDPRRGKGFSLQRGFAYALEQGYTGVIAMDGDGQHDPADLPNFLAVIKDQPLCLANGTRMGNAANMPIVRRVTNQFMSWMISRMCGRHIEDTQCGFRYLGADLLRQIELKANDFEIETEMLVKSCRVGCQVLSVPIKTIYRDEKSKINPVKDTLRFVLFLLRESRNKKS